jgi:uncharacterized oxidoreductase
MKTTGNTILIAGGTSGIGLALAERFHALGNKVIVAGRRRELLDQIKREHPGIDGEVFDITDPASIADLYQNVTTKYPELGAIIAMSGIMVPERVLDPGPLEVAERTITTNLIGTIRLVHQFAPFLVQQPEAAIVTVTSGLAYVPLPITPTYSATKAAVHSYTESLRAQLSDTSVQVIEIAPPYLRTTLMGEHQANDENAMPLDEFADETIKLLQTQPAAAQILVERVKRQRFAEADGTYDEILAMQSARTA